MKYDPIKIELHHDAIDFYFDRPNGKAWFYQIHPVLNEKDIEDWDNHLREKMWYTPDIRNTTLNLMHDIIA